MTNNIQFDEFLRSVLISKNDSYAILLGAGCSVTSDIQSASDCIWDWKKTIYKTNNSNAGEWIDNYKNPKVQEVIQKWIDNQGLYVENGHEDEYTFYAEKCFLIEENRRQYFQSICTGKIPSVGYMTLPLLLKQGMLDSVWSTNFDDLVSRACVMGNVQGIEITLDSTHIINQRAQNRLELPIIKLHGDFKYGKLKNTSDELQHQDETFRQKLIEYLGDKHLIVLGYSGRDKSLMSTLKEAYNKSGSGRLFWCGYSATCNSEVNELLGQAKKVGRSAFYIPNVDFDNTLVNLTKLLITDRSELKEEMEILQKNIRKKEIQTPFDLNVRHTNKVLKSNCFPIDFPKEIFVFDAIIREKPWKLVKDRTLTNLNITAVPYGKSIWAWGKLEDIRSSFSDIVEGSITRKPLTDISVYNSSLNFLLLSAICKVICSKYRISTNFKDKLWDVNVYQIINNTKVYNAVKLSLEKIGDLYYLVLNPDFYLDNSELTKDQKQQIGLMFFHRIWNQRFNEYIDKWRMKIFSSISYDFPEGSGNGFLFKFSKAPIFTNIYDHSYNAGRQHNVPSNLLKLKGVQFKEVDLVFSSQNGNRDVFDIHPMRGLLNHRPYETALNTFLDTNINLGIICPVIDAELFYTFLLKQNLEIPKANPKDNHLLDFKGFYKTYGITLNIPLIGGNDWEGIHEPLTPSIKDAAQQIKRNICDKISKLCSTGGQKIIIIFIPSRWELFTSYYEEGESFDLHDYIKAYCAEKGVTSQFIREHTVRDSKQSCQINWWLSLSYYVKSLRTPWVINNTDKSTAFAGIGYSVSSKDESNGRGHIIIGCSHIYSSTGEGLKYKLSKISNDKVSWRDKKPHLSYDDAYEFGRNILNLFYQSMNEVPKRVVVHKRTFFTEEEKQGIIDSLYDNKKIENVDLVEINFEEDIRYVASKISNQTTTIDGYSVSRGTCIQLSANEALLYAHGVIPSVQNPNFNDYPGGRYIPKPLRIIKHYGNGSLEVIANEILGLTKMDWNSLNMYSQLPATISSSNQIARIGKLLENKERVEYDYRYFI